jgi:hypothetical protein
MHHTYNPPVAYASRLPPRPLIDRVTNEWQLNPKYSDLYGDDHSDDEFGPGMGNSDEDSLLSIPRRLPRRVKRYILGYIVFLCTCTLAWQFWLRPSIDLEDNLDRSMAQMTGKANFGINVRPEFTGMNHLKFLDTALLPGATAGSPKRLVIVGDVHGCKEERESTLILVSSLLDH